MVYTPPTTLAEALVVIAQLVRRLDELEAENVRLRAENARLRALFKPDPNTAGAWGRSASHPDEHLAHRRIARPRTGELSARLVARTAPDPQSPPPRRLINFIRLKCYRFI